MSDRATQLATFMAEYERAANSVGVRERRSGLARRAAAVAGPLLRSRLARCDQAGEPAYLESSKLANVPLYQHFGFEPTEPTTMPDGAPVITPMWRVPTMPARG